MSGRKILIGVLATILVIYLLGPKPATPVLSDELPSLSLEVNEVASYLAEQESKVENIKPENEARIIWADSIPAKTKYVLLYLHGFSASGMEGSPIHQKIAKRYNFNLYLPRLYGHGIKSDDVFIDLTADKLWDSAKEAIAVASQIGDSIIIMSCSTGGTLGLFASSYYPEIHSVILYSPNIDLADPKSGMLTKPWGLPLARKAFGGNHREFAATEEQKHYWTNRYRLEGLINMKKLVDHTMIASTFGRIKQPVFLGYYYEDEEHQDDIVSVPRMREMMQELSTSEDKKMEVAFPDVGGHVINSGLLSKDVEGVLNETTNFIENVLHIKPTLNE